MAISNFIRFFDKSGHDMNFGPTYSTLTSLYDGATSSYLSYEGRLFFPKVSNGLIESQQIFLLEEVTGPSTNFELRRVQGTVTLVSGNPNVSGAYSDFTVLQAGNDIKIGDDNYTVTSVSGATSMQVTPTPSISLTTEDIYYYDYLSYSELRSSPGTFQEKITTEVPDSQTEFFIYSVNYSEDIPFIERSFYTEYDVADGSSDSGGGSGAEWEWNSGAGCV